MPAWRSLYSVAYFVIECIIHSVQFGDILLTLTVLVTTTDALGHFEIG